MIELYGYSALTKEDYLNSPVKCSNYVHGSNPNAFFDIMSNKSILCFDHEYGNIDYSSKDLSEKFIKDLHSISFTDLINKIDPPTLRCSEVPLINSIDSINILLDHMALGLHLTYDMAGGFLCNVYAKKTAKEKAGEIHLKLLSSMSLGNIQLITPRQCRINQLGLDYIALSQDERDAILRKLMLKIPVVCTLFQNAKYGAVSIRDVVSSAGITGTTIGRRSSSVRTIVNYIDECDDADLHELYLNINP